MPRKIEYIYLIFATAIAIYAAYAFASGEVIAYQRAGLSETRSIESDPEGFWGTVLVYVGMALVLSMLAIKEYFPPKLNALLNFGFNSKLSIRQVVFVISLAAVMCTAIFWLAGVLANA